MIQVVKLTEAQALQIRNADIKFNPSHDETGWYISIKAATLLNQNHGYNLDLTNLRTYKPIKL